MSEKNALENLVDAAKAKVSEGVDRAKAAGHDIAAEVGNNPLENAAHKVKAVAEHAKADIENAKAKVNLEETKEKANDPL